MEANSEQNNLENKTNEKQEKKIKEPTKWWIVLIEYLVCFIVAAGIGLATLAIRDFFDGGLDKLTTYRYLSDAFTIPGMTFLCLALLVLFAKQGAFTGILYALRHVGRMIVPFLVRKDITYAEYLALHDKKKGFAPLLCFFVVGGVCIAISIIFIILFSNVENEQKKKAFEQLAILLFRF